MAEQPSFRPLEPSRFFSQDERSARPIPAGAVARGQFRDNEVPATGRVRGRADTAGAASLAGLGTSGPLAIAASAGPLGAGFSITDYTAFPFAVTRDVLERGRERYTIFCAVCHDATGNGNGKIVQRGYTRPPVYSTDNSRAFALRGVAVPLRDVPAGYLFEVITKGFGAMPDYASQIPPDDRWSIASYVHALQLSGYARLEDLPPNLREAARKALGGNP
jgi:mono/diheme cytochrome c family protein